ncbi:MAG: hypothetical protein M1497_09535 [Nitrospirae bacterium]|nr:hypothetical protein [Nitrospirota bacterium]
MNILILKVGALGDVVRTSYILPGLHRKYDSPKIWWLTSSASFDLLRFNPYISELLVAEMPRNLSQTMFDLVISLDDEVELLSLLDGVRYREIIGAYLKEGKPVYTDSAEVWFDMGLISRFGKTRADELKKLNRREHNQIFASMFGIEIKEPAFFNSPLIEKAMARRFGGNYFSIGINSGAGSRWQSKELLFQETVALIRKLLSLEVSGRKTAVYLLGGKEEEERHRRIRSIISSERLFDAGNGNSLLEFAAIIKACDYVIASDSLAVHLAISQKVKNLSFFAPTSAAEIGTFGTGVKVISLSPDYCSYSKDVDNSTITAERILAKMMTHLNGSEG